MRHQDLDLLDDDFRTFLKSKLRNGPLSSTKIIGALTGKYRIKSLDALGRLQVAIHEGWLRVDLVGDSVLYSLGSMNFEDLINLVSEIQDRLESNSSTTQQRRSQ